jgi:hypothetical protein
MYLPPLSETHGRNSLSTVMSAVDFVRDVTKALLSGVIGVMGISAGFIVPWSRGPRGLFVTGVGMRGEGQGNCINKREFRKCLRWLDLHQYILAYCMDYTLVFTAQSHDCEEP